VKTVVLFGSGAMSCLFAAKLASIAQVTVLGTWREGVEAIRERGVRIEDAGHSRSVAVEAVFSGDVLPTADLALVLVKSWQTARVATCLSKYLKPDGCAISLQNGLGNIELLGPRAFPGATAEGATLIGPGHVRAGGTGLTQIVAPDWVVDLFQSAGLECRSCSPGAAEGLIWGKLCVSCGINAPTALLRIPNGELLKRPETACLMSQAATECAAVARARGISLPFTDASARVREVAERTAANKSSMLQDILRGAPTECDAINGAVAREGNRLGIPVPVNETLWRLVRAAAFYSKEGAIAGNASN
jgi:2-dehydropantoate 2-reductase